MHDGQISQQLFDRARNHLGIVGVTDPGQERGVLQQGQGAEVDGLSPAAARPLPPAAALLKGPRPGDWLL
ncbi:hypothetical protein [Nonomuraea angiospora]